MRRARRSLVIVAAVLFSASSAVAQFVQQGSKLVGSESIGYIEQGESVGISADGNTVIVGGSQDGVKGAIWFYTRTGSIWTQQGPKLVAADATVGASFGYAVALSSDGNTAIVGGPEDNGSAGAAWIFVRANGAWTQQGPKLVGSDGGGYQGWAVAISADGNTAMGAAIGDNGFAGATWVFVRSGTTWSQQGAKLTVSGIGPAEFGRAIALSADGNTALVGTDFVDEVWAFTRSGTIWSPLGEPLTPSDASPPPSWGVSLFGTALALSADGSTAAIGGMNDAGFSGAVWIFTRSGSTWTQQGPKLVGAGASAPPYIYQGSSVSLSNDGSTLVEGAIGDDHGAGAAWVFTRNGSTWSQTGAKLVGTGAVNAAVQGESLRLSGDGMTAIVGGWYDNGGMGAAWIFTRTSDLRHAGDHDGDMRSDITLYHIPSGQWASLTSSNNFLDATNRFWGGPAYAAAPGDYDGDGRTDLGLYDPSTGDWYVLLSSTNFTTSLSKNVGGPGWTMVPRDFDGDGKTDFAVYNSTTGQWYGLNSSTNYTTTFSVFWGGSTYLQVPADYDGDGRADFGVYNLDTGVWSILLSSTNYTTSLSKPCGGSGWTPVPADYDGDGKADLVVYNYNPGTWYGLKSTGNYLTTINVNWGGSNYQPVKGDYDGDGKADFAVYVSNTGMWYILLSGANYTTSIVRNWGGVGWAAIPQFP